MAMHLGIHALDAANLVIEPTLDANGFSLKLSGTCDAFAVAPLGSYLTRVFAEMERLGCMKVTFDIQGVCFLNSSCLKQFVTFLHRLRSLGTNTKPSVEFLVDAKLGWQRRALAAFVRMCPDIVSVTSAGADDVATHTDNA